MSMFLLLLLSLYLYQPFTQSLPIHLDPRIVSGTPSKSSQFPFIAALRSIEQDINGVEYMSESWCGGSLLRLEYPATILTSSHCVFNTTKQIVVELNASDVHQTPIIGITAWPVLSYVMHEQFDLFLLDNDIALLFIDADLTQRTDLFISAVTIPHLVDTNECCTEHDILQTMGYGRTALDAPYSDSLEYTNLAFMDRTACNEQLCLWETSSTNCPWHYANNNNICALGDATAPCHGDSGGPLVKKDTHEQVGIVSWGILCISTLPTIFTNTGVYYTWIQQQLQINGHTPLPTTAIPSANPTKTPSFRPTNNPSLLPTPYPTVTPTKYPSLFTKSPSMVPSVKPTREITDEPTSTTRDTTAIPTRYTFTFPTSDPSHRPTARHTEEEVDTTDLSRVATETIGNDTATPVISSTYAVDTTAMEVTMYYRNPIDLAVLKARTIDEYVIIIILAGISGVAIFVIGIMCFQKNKCGSNQKDNDPNGSYDRVKVVSNPLVYPTDDDEDMEIVQAIECVAMTSTEDKPCHVTESNIEEVNDETIITDLMAETTASSPNNSLITAFTLHSANL
eukprot:137413_1